MEGPRIICPKCSHEFEIKGRAKSCDWCSSRITAKGNKKYCSDICRIKGRRWHAYLKQKSDPNYKRDKREYMRYYMREYRKRGV